MNTIVKTTPAPAPVAKPSALNLMAMRLSCDPAKLLDTLKATVFKNATNEEVMALVVVSNEYQLNPLLKEMYAFPAKGGGIVPVVSVDGWNKMLIRQPDFDGIEFSFEHDDQRRPISCTASVYFKSRTRPMKITEYFDECYRKTDNWENMPHRMLRNRTLCQASRMSFGFSGIYNEDEAQTITVDSVVVPTVPPRKLVSATATATVTTDANSDEQAEAEAGLAPLTPAPAPVGVSESAKLETLVTEAGFNFSEFTKWAEGSGNVPDATSLASFSEVPEQTCRRLLRAHVGLLAGLSSNTGKEIVKA